MCMRTRNSIVCIHILSVSDRCLVKQIVETFQPEHEEKELLEMALDYLTMQVRPETIEQIVPTPTYLQYIVPAGKNFPSALYKQMEEVC